MAHTPNTVPCVYCQEPVARNAWKCLKCNGDQPLFRPFGKFGRTMVGLAVLLVVAVATYEHFIKMWL